MYRILLFAGVRAASGMDHVELEIDAEESVRDVLRKLEQRLPDSAGLIRISRLAIDGAYVNEDDVIADRAGELALIPPVSGG